MAETKIKVNELPSATPTLNDTLVGSNATKEYACKIEDLASLVGGGGIVNIGFHQQADGEPTPAWVEADETYSSLYDGTDHYITKVTPRQVIDGMTNGTLFVGADNTIPEDPVIPVFFNTVETVEHGQGVVSYKISGYTVNEDWDLFPSPESQYNLESYGLDDVFVSLFAD